MNVVVTGDIGAGKSTAVRAAMQRLGWTKPAGFFTHWDGKERGADLLCAESWAGERHPMARRIAAPAAPGGLPYELDPDFSRFAVAALAGTDSGRPVVLDELGVIELGAPDLAAAVAAAFRGPAPVLAVVQRRALGRWLDVLGPGAADRLLQLDLAGRDALPAQIAALFRA